MDGRQESVVRDRRTNLATKNNLMGPAGKLGVILRAFGVPVTRQGSGLADATYLDDPYADDPHAEYQTTLSGQPGPLSYRDEILDSGDYAVEEEGLLFDGLTRGLHLEVLYWHALNRLTVTYKGYEVYRETAGELHGYAPFPEWETAVDRLYRAAKERVKRDKRDGEAAVARAVERHKRSYWQELKLRWGL